MKISHIIRCFSIRYIANKFGFNNLWDTDVQTNRNDFIVLAIYLMPPFTCPSQLCLAQSYNTLPYLRLLGITKQMESNSHIFAKEGERERERLKAHNTYLHSAPSLKQFLAIFRMQIFVCQNLLR